MSVILPASCFVSLHKKLSDAIIIMSLQYINLFLLISAEIILMHNVRYSTYTEEMGVKYDESFSGSL